jgi:hypothetical protein
LGIKSEIRLVKKSYLRKNKKKIISINFFKKYGVYRSMYEAFENCKTIKTSDTGRPEMFLVIFITLTGLDFTDFKIANAVFTVIN